eukprot:ctg_588.g273
MGSGIFCREAAHGSDLLGATFQACCAGRSGDWVGEVGQREVVHTVEGVLVSTNVVLDGGKYSLFSSSKHPPTICNQESRGTRAPRKC